MPDLSLNPTEFFILSRAAKLGLLYANELAVPVEDIYGLRLVVRQYQDEVQRLTEKLARASQDALREMNS